MFPLQLHHFACGTPVAQTIPIVRIFGKAGSRSFGSISFQWLLIMLMIEFAEAPAQKPHRILEASSRMFNGGVDARVAPVVNLKRRPLLKALYMICSASGSAGEPSRRLNTTAAIPAP